MTSVVKHLPEYRQKRVSFCGAPMPKMIKADGSTIEGARFHCTDRYCDSCARARAQRVYVCILDKLKNSMPINPNQSGFRMVTLTIRKKQGLSANHLREAVERLGRVQLKTHELLRRHDYCAERIDYHRAQGKTWKVREWRSELLGIFPPLTHWMGGGISAKASDQAKSAPRATLGRTTYAWAREITTGADGGGWHIHAHYLVPSESDAERFVSAWLTAAESLGIKASIKAQKISEPDKAQWDRPGKQCGAEDAASYITHYITKGIESDEMSEDVLFALVRGTHGMRQYDAGGDWRPLGIGKKREEDHVAVERVQWSEPVIRLDASIEWQSRGMDAQSFFSNGAPYWRTLNQYRTNLTKSDLDDAMLQNAVIEYFSTSWRGEIDQKVINLAKYAERKKVPIDDYANIIYSHIGN